MPDYLTPKWATVNSDVRLKWTEEEWTNAKIDHDEIAKLNSEEYKRRYALYKQMLDIAKEIYGQHALVIKYLNKQHIPTTYHIDFDRAYNSWKENLKKIDVEKKLKEEKIQCDKLVGEAVIYLQDHGKKIGVDFEISFAVEQANSLAYELEIEKQKKSPTEFIGFSGDDNCENCEGWDKQSRRCDCGNRRVSWTEGYGHSFKQPYIYAEAY